MMTARVSDALVEQHFAARVVHCLDEVQILLFAEVGLIRVRTPDETAHVHTTTRTFREHPCDFRSRAVQTLVRIAAPVGEVDPFVALQLTQHRVEPAEVLATVHEHVGAHDHRV